LNGNEIATKVMDNLKQQLDKLNSDVRLAVILIGDDSASELYVSKKEKACAKLGMNSERHHLGSNVSQKEVIYLIEKLNDDEKINGIMVQLPLPAHLEVMQILETISSKKDVDGLTSKSIAKLLLGDEIFAPCTPKGIIALLEAYNIPIQGSEVVIVNHSNIVGRPLAAMFLNRNATVSVCHKFTKNLASYTKKADILVSGVGKAGLITADMIKQGAVIIDVGFDRVNGKLCGDVDFDKVKEKASYITPVPGGVGPMTVSMLMKNTVQAKEISQLK